MNSTSVVLLACTTLVYFCGMFTTVYGKCSGRWSIHACYGGNGKRSGPPSNPSISNKLNDKQYILSQLLLSDQMPKFTEDYPKSDMEEDQAIDNALNSLYPEIDQAKRQNNFDRAKTLLGALIMESKFRNSPDDIEFRR